MPLQSPLYVEHRLTGGGEVMTEDEGQLQTDVNESLETSDETTGVDVTPSGTER